MDLPFDIRVSFCWLRASLLDVSGYSGLAFSRISYTPRHAGRRPVVDRPATSVPSQTTRTGVVRSQRRQGKQTAHWTRLSCHRFRANEVRLQLSVLAYNLGNLWRRLVLPRRIDSWSLTSLQQRLVKTGGRLVKHARYYWLLLAESHLTRRLFGSMLRRIWALPVPTG